MNDAIMVIKEDFQTAWKTVVAELMDNDWELFNVVVQIMNPCALDKQFHGEMKDFSKSIGIMKPKSVAYTIFPHKLYNRTKDRHKVFNQYQNIVLPKLRTMDHFNWGTYFQRMIAYNRDGETINQLENIINAINDRKTLRKAAYTLVIEKPGSETVRPMGAPCLNYVAVQAENDDGRTTISLLCVYRNHDFLRRAYGNYWGLCNLLGFIACETNSKIGKLTCVSSHAYIENKKSELKRFMEVFF